MNYYIITDSNVFMCVAAKEIKDEDEESVTFSEVFFMMIVRENSRAFLSGSETFFTYNCEESDEFSVEPTSLNYIIDKIKYNSSLFKNRSSAIKAFFEPNPNGNN